MRLATFTPYGLLLPFMTILGVFGLFPIAFSLLLSLAHWDGITSPTFVGLENYAKLIHDSTFWTALWNTVLSLGIALPVQLVVAVAVAYWLHMGLVRGKDWFQTILFLPYITTPVAVGLLFANVLDYQYGLVNGVLLAFGWIAEPIPWLVAPQYGKPIIAAILDWKYIGYTVIFVLAGMKNVPQEIYEAAEIDGATVADRFWMITLPLIRGAMTFVVITGLINVLQVFDEPYLLYGAANGFSGQVAAAFGGPGNTGLSLVMYLYQSAYKFHDWGYAAAIGYVLAAVIMAFSVGGIRALGVRQ